MATIPEAFATALEHYQAGQLRQAEQLCQDILRRTAQHEGAWYLLGVIAYHLGTHGRAIDSITRAITLRPDIPEFHDALGAACAALGKYDEAVASCERAVQLRPDYASAHNNLGNALVNQGKFDEAAASYQRALQSKPDSAHVHNNLGTVFRMQGKLDQAVASYKRAVQIKPDYATVHNTLGILFNDQGKIEEALASFTRALEIKPDYAMAHSNLVFTQHYLPSVTLAGLASAHAEWDRQHARPLKNTLRPFANSRDPQRRLRLGFVSPDFCRHPVAVFLVGALERLDPRSCETFCYFTGVQKDDLTERIASAVQQWREVTGLSDLELTEQIRSDRIDILFDLAGHTSDNRLLVFARKPAPIQVTWIGYPGTTGLAAMDFLIADRYHVPEGSESHYREEVLRLPETHVCFEPPSDAPEVGPLPALAKGYLTFGSFNNPAKITPEVVEVWAEILSRVPKARLVLKYRGLGAESTRRRYTEKFSDHGVDPSRLELLGKSPHAEMLDEYNRIDVALDPFPFCGGMTTCLALWMGVPVITRQGETFAGRQSLSFLSHVGLTETVAADLSDYVERAVALTHNLPRLGTLRAELRQRVRQSPLCDRQRFANNLMDALRTMWRDWCQTHGEG